MAERRWSETKQLPSNVEEDCDVVDGMEFRVPVLGLHRNHPWGKQQQDQPRCDSGVFDSFQSGTSSVRSSYADRSSFVLDSMDEASLQDKLKNLNIEQKQASAHERLPSVDEGFYSTEDSVASWNVSNSKIVFPPELPSEKQEVVEAPEPEHEIDDRILEIFLQDDEGDT